MNSQCNINEATYIDVSSKDLFPFGINLISIRVDDYHVTIQCAMAYETGLAVRQLAQDRFRARKSSRIGWKQSLKCWRTKRK